MQPKLFDTHTHFNFNAFKDDWEEVIERTLQNNVWFVNVGAEAKTSKRAADIALKCSRGVFAAIGLHPIHVYDYAYEEIVNAEEVKFTTKTEDFDKKYYLNLIESSEKVIAIGETGLDYFHIRNLPTKLNKKLKNKQAEVFIEQIALAGQCKKPIIIHCRPEKNYDAYREILEIVKDYSICHSRAGGNPGFKEIYKPKHLDPRISPVPYGTGSPKDDNSVKIPGIVHCFQADLKIMEEFLNLGFMIGYNGIITFTDQYDQLVKATPLKNIVLETDSPWLTPVPHRGQRNESIHVEFVAKRIAELKNISFKEIAQATTNNAMRVFGII